MRNGSMAIPYPNYGRVCYVRLIANYLSKVTTIFTPLGEPR